MAFLKVKPMYNKFRVICCKNEDKYPGKLFIDIYPADHITHELLFRMRQKITPDVYDITGGVYLDDLGNGQVRLKYVKHADKMLQKQQAKMRAIIDQQIEKLFLEMKKRGIDKTIQGSLSTAYEMFSLSSVYAKSTKEEEMMATQKRFVAREKIMKQRQAYYANRTYASQPHLYLALAQLKYRGD